MGDMATGGRLVFTGVLNEALNGHGWRAKKGRPKGHISLFFGVEKWAKNGVGVTVGVTNGVTFRASIDPHKGKKTARKREKRAETPPLIPFNA